LLLGFLFAMAILAPIYLAYFFVGLEVENFKTFASTPLFLFFYLFGQFAIYRARRYRLTRTVWRGVRFWMSGSGWLYAMKSALWGLLVIFTLGLALPWREAALERYKMGHSYYGDLQGSFEGRGWDFFKRAWGIWLFAAIALSILSFTLPLSRFFPALVPLVKIIPFASLLFFLSMPFLYGLFKAMEWRWWLSGIRFGEARFKSDLLTGALVGLYWKVIGWFLLISVIFVVYLLLCAASVAGINQAPMDKMFTPANLQGSIPMLAFAVIGYLALVLMLNVVLRVYLLRDVWVRVISSTSIYHIEALSAVAAEGEMANALGEGFADGLDVAGF